MGQKGDGVGLKREKLTWVGSWKYILGKSRARRKMRSLNSWKERPRKKPVNKTEEVGRVVGEEQSRRWGAQP